MTATHDDSDRGAHFVQSLERGLAVIRCFNAEHPRLTLSEVAHETGLTRAAARRFLLTLADLGYVRSDGRYFSLTARVLELGFSYLSSLTLPEVANPHLERLSAAVHESCSVSVLDAGEVVYVARVAASRIMTVSINVGTRFPAYATSMGHVLLAGLTPEALGDYLAATTFTPFTDRTIIDEEALRRELERVREQGFSIVDQELEEGLRSIAAPVRDPAGAVIAAVNISAHASRRTIDAMKDELLPSLLTAAKNIEADLAAASGR